MAAMQLLVLATVLVYSSAFIFMSNTVNEIYQGYHFEQHSSHRLFLIRDQLNCYLVHMDNAMQQALLQPVTKRAVEDGIIAKINAGSDVKDVGNDEIKQDYHDYLASAQCSNLAVHVVAYSYVPATTATPVVGTTS